ncbi:acyl-CoA dehydrogenase family protein [Salinibacterium sp. ZJ454]|uniref:acyl-CoA dehydrogenase family protein n=1 Tax=Salinibacterium sp. ZJ454 TaxID=2708339 RepID=UPI00141E83F1|nr:acyl-CoA dehydrogenase family protein [Salinibacterium sp. ZJ454]
MRFEPDEELSEFVELASEVLGAAERLAVRPRAAVDEDDWFDSTASRHLHETGLLVACLPESLGGSGLGALGLSLLLEQAGSALVRVPVLEWVVAATTLHQFGGGSATARQVVEELVEGRTSVTLALTCDPASLAPAQDVSLAPADGGWVLEGRRDHVPYLKASRWVLVPVASAGGEPAVVLIDTSDDRVGSVQQHATSGQPLNALVLDGVTVPADRVLIGANVWTALRDLAFVASASMQLGVARSALRMTANYTSGREQFGRALAQFQAVAMRVADMSIDVDNLENVVRFAAWSLQKHPAATREVLVARYWAAVCGQRVVTNALHLHGGMGADIDYGLDGYVRRSKQLELAYGSGGHALAMLGEVIVHEQ